MARIDIIDGFRGSFLLLMFLSHVAFLDTMMRRFSHHNLGYADVAMGFVLLSGFVIALVYGRLMDQTSFRVMRDRLHRRALTVYGYNLVVLCIVFGLALGAFEFSDAVRQFALIGAHALRDLALSLLLIDGPKFVGILPMYIIFMIFTPYVLQALRAGKMILVVSVSVTLWTIGQTTLVADALALLWAGLGGPVQGGLDLRAHFDRWTWQILFVAGLVAGTLYAQGRLPLHRLTESQFERLFHVSLVCILLFMFIRQMPRIPFTDSLDVPVAMLDRTRLGVLVLVDLCAFAYALTCLAVAGPGSNTGWIAALGRGVNAVFTWRPLVFLGQHSLQVYSLHVILIYLAYVLVLQLEITPGPGIGDAILLGGWALLFLPCFYMAWRKSRATRKVTVAAAPYVRNQG